MLKYREIPHALARRQRPVDTCLGGMLIFVLALASVGHAQAPKITISMDRSSLNQMISHLHGATFANTWEGMPFQPSLALQVDTAEVVAIRDTDGTIDLDLAGNVKIQYSILDVVHHSSLGFTAELRTRPVNTEAQILLQVVKTEIKIDEPPIPNDIQLFPIQELVRKILLPEYIPLLDMRNLPKVTVPLPGKKPVTVRPTTPQVGVGKDRLTVFMTLKIEETPLAVD